MWIVKQELYLVGKPSRFQSDVSSEQLLYSVSIFH